MANFTLKDKDGLILLDQIRTLQRTRLLKRLGKAPVPVVEETLARPRELFER
ncbi:type II toxin-antitoxin system PemK/MazF family toxin [Enterovirga aerilata]|uniref:Uncharacterized protein n=1 Tax=Enterovirga aerilata TaxID=2730920 RepID=A0A849I399_9HYPH|nr:type II toxin-antitoxin system PemK/MazF family toxin [Enterovirga sp. DB1703]NNM74276.1 hypothetical protein [Enterovirga sp. DB1703]